MIEMDVRNTPQAKDPETKANYTLYKFSASNAGSTLIDNIQKGIEDAARVFEVPYPRMKVTIDDPANEREKNLKKESGKVTCLQRRVCPVLPLYQGNPKSIRFSQVCK
jgi:hypothetical protein